MLNSFMRRISVSALVLCLCALPSISVAEGKPLSAASKAEIEKLVHDYILANPEVILESVRRHQEQQEAAEAEAQKRHLVTMRGQLERAKTSPVGGNLQGDVTVVEFFDYRCGYCKRVHDVVLDAVKSDGNVRLVYKEFPILGPDSVVAARAALGVFFNTPDKYAAFNDALMRTKGGLNLARVMDIATSIGLDAEAVKKNMDDPRVDEEIDSNIALAQALNIQGTPAFVIDTTLVPGALDRETLVNLILAARKG